MVGGGWFSGFFLTYDQFGVVAQVGTEVLLFPFFQPPDKFTCLLDGMALAAPMALHLAWFRLHGTDLLLTSGANAGKYHF